MMRQYILHKNANDVYDALKITIENLHTSNNFPH